MPFPVQSARFASFLRRLFSLQGYLGLQQVDDVFPVIPLSRDDDPADRAALGEIFWAEGLTQAAVAGQFSAVFVAAFDPGKLVTIDEVWVHGDPAGVTAFEFRAQAYLVNGTGGAGLVTGCDTRLQPAPLSSGVTAGVRTTAASTAALTIGRQFFGEVGAGRPQVFRPNVVLVARPGGDARFEVDTEAVNTKLDVTFIGRSRLIAEQEKNPVG